MCQPPGPAAASLGRCQDGGEAQRRVDLEAARPGGGDGVDVGTSAGEHAPITGAGISGRRADHHVQVTGVRAAGTVQRFGAILAVSRVFI